MYKNFLKNKKTCCPKCFSRDIIIIEDDFEFAFGFRFKPNLKETKWVKKNIRPCVFSSSIYLNKIREKLDKKFYRNSRSRLCIRQHISSVVQQEKVFTLFCNSCKYEDIIISSLGMKPKGNYG